MNNSYWGKYAPPEPLNAIHWTKFERRCLDLNLGTFDQQKENSELRKWVEKNMRNYYVPEKLLKAWGLSVYIDVD